MHDNRTCHKQIDIVSDCLIDKVEAQLPKRRVRQFLSE